MEPNWPLFPETLSAAVTYTKLSDFLADNDVKTTAW